jgi:Tfp pilus assembly protein PilV
MYVKARKRNKGFSIIEAMLSVFMVTCAAAILTSAMPAATVSRMKGNYLNKAANFSQKEIELMKAQTYANLTATKLLAADLIDSSTPVSSNTFSCNSTDAASGDRVSDILPSGTATVKVEQVDIELKRITVTVNWVERGRNRSYAVASLVANL